VAVATVDIQINSQGAVRSLNQVDVASRNTQSALQKLDGVVGSLAASFAAGFAINRVINDVKELDTNIRRLGTVGVNVAKINPALSALSDRLGGVANKAELAAASYQAASAGFSDTAGNIRILEAATKAATGGLADNQGVTEVLVKTLNAYGMSGTQAYQVTDSISKAVELGNQEWSDYVSQLGRVASMAALAGVSLDEMNAFIASATKNGATAEVAFTGLSSVLTQLLQPTKESQTAAAQLGIQWNLMGLQTKGLGGLMKELAVAINKDKEAAARMVGPTEAMRGAFAAASKDGKDFETILGQIGNASGKTDADFQTMKGSLENTFKALDTSFKNLSEALGKAFGPTLVITIQDITKNVNGFAAAMSAVPQPVMNATGELVKLIAQMILVQKAIQGVIGLHVAFVAATTAITGSVAASGTAATGSATAFALYTTNARTLQAASIATAGSVTGLTTALLGLAGIGIVTVGINYVITQTGAVLGSASAAEKSLAARSQQSLAEQLKGKTVEERQKMLKTTQKNLANDRKLASTLALQIRAQDARAESAAEMAAPADRAKLMEVQARVKTNQARIKAITSIPLEKPKKPELPPTPTGVSGTGAGKDEKKKAKKERESELAQIQAANGLFASQEVIKARIAKAEYDQNQLEVMRLQMVGRGVDLLAQAAAIQREKIPQDEKDAKMLGVRNGLIASENQYQREIAQYVKQQQEPLDAIILANKTKFEDDKAYQRLLAEGINPELAQQYVEIDRAGKALQKSLEPAVALAKAAVLEAEARGMSAEKIAELKKSLEDLQKLPGQKVDEAKKGAEAANQPKSEAEKVAERIATLKKEITGLTSISTMAITAADGIGAAFANSFQSLIQGSMNAQEALASFFQNVASMFIEMAMQIIAKQMIMIVLQSILKALGGGGSNLNAPANINNPLGDLGTIGGAYTGKAIGGPVTGNASYMVGERGPEIFTPSTSGNITPNNRLRDVMGGSPASAGGGQMLNMTFETTRFGNTEYVSRDQLEAAMAQTRRQAANDGAKRGMGMTLDKLQQSPQTRSRVGIR